jgi:hypothetical protein
MCQIGKNSEHVWKTSPVTCQIIIAVFCITVTCVNMNLFEIATTGQN